MTFDQTKKALILGFLAGFIWNLCGEASVRIYQLMVARLPAIDEIAQQNGWVKPARDLVGLIMVFGYVFIIIKICQRLYQQVELPERNEYTPWLVLSVSSIPGLFFGAMIFH